MNLELVIGSIPDYDVYWTVDEMNASTERLAGDFPDLVTVKTTGESQKGEPVQLISIGEGERNALVYAGAHGNEATGAMTGEFLSRCLCENEELRRELGYRWHFIKCIDPESMRLNEGWFKGPFTELQYHVNYYRQAQDEQPEYMFPVEYKTLQFDQPLPESRALQAAIDAIRPEFMWSLHNSDFGGVYCHVSWACEPLQEVFPQILKSFDLPYDFGESSLPVESFAPGINKRLSLKDIYDAMMAAGVEDPAGKIGWRGMASDYAEDRYGTFYFVVEAPYWAFEAMGDTSPVDIRRAEDIEQARSRGEAFAEWLGSHIDRVHRDLRLKTPFHRLIDEQMASRRGRSSGLAKLVHKDADADRPATRAEHFTSVYWQEHTRQRIRGIFIRMLEAEIGAGNDTDEIISARDAVFAQMQEVGARLDDELDYSAHRLSIRTAVGCNTWAGLVAAGAIP